MSSSETSLDYESKPNFFSKLALFFINNYRITVSFLLILIATGTLAYTTFLPKEGFPPIQIPTSIVSTTYVVNDSNKVNDEVTVPIEKVVSEIEGVSGVSSSTSSNSSTINVFWSEEVDLQLSFDKLEQSVKENANLPENVEVNYIQPDVNKFLNKYDALVGIYATGGQSLKETQLNAENFARFIEGDKNITKAELVPLVKQQTDPITGQSYDFQDSFNRVGVDNNGEIVFYDAVQVGVNKENSIDALRLSDVLSEQIEQYKSESGNSNFAFILQGDNAIKIRSDLDNLEVSILIGMFFALIVVLLLISWRAGIVIAIFIPVVMSFVFVRLWTLGLSLNTISFFGLIIALGLFVDDATVVVESVYTYKAKGKSNFEAIKLAINEIGMASFVGSLTTILVFAPMFFVSGILGNFITDLPISVILSLVASFLLSLTFIPFVTNLILGKDKPIETKNDKKNIPTLGDLVDSTGLLLGKIILGTQKNRRRSIITISSVLLGTLALFGIGILNLQSVPFDTFADQKDSDEIILSISYPEKTSIQAAQEIAADVEQTLVSELGDNLEAVSYTKGDQRKATMLLAIKPMDEREQTTSEMVGRLNLVFDAEDRADISTAVQGSARSQGAGDEFTFSVNVRGENTENILNAAKQIETFITNLEIDSTKGERVLDTKIENIAIIAKQDQVPFVTVKASLSDDTTGTTTALRRQIENEFNAEKLESFGLDPDALAEDPNSTDAQFNESLVSLAMNFVLVLVIMYFVLMILYKSFSQPVLIFLAPLFSIPGILIGLSVTNNALGFFPILGLLGLFGISVNNTIMLVDFANSQRADGKSILESIANATQARFRSIFTTSLTTIAALSVMLIDPFWQSLAVTMISGLVSSVVLVMFTFPYFYIVIEWFRQKKNEKFGWLK